MQYDFFDPDGNYDLLYSYVKDKQLRRVIDIGAWWGPWSLWWHDKAQHVEIFEPNQQIIPKLKKNIKDLLNCKLYEVALGDKLGNVSMECASHSGTYHIKDTNGSISLKTLDSFEFDCVDIIKIDAEGYEVPVLEGARNTIIKNKPWIFELRDLWPEIIFTQLDYLRKGFLSSLLEKIELFLYRDCFVDQGASDAYIRCGDTEPTKQQSEDVVTYVYLFNLSSFTQNEAISHI